MALDTIAVILLQTLGYNLLLVRLLYLNYSSVISFCKNVTCGAVYAVSPENSLTEKMHVCRTEWNNDGGIIVTDNAEISDCGISCFPHIYTLGKLVFGAWEDPSFHGRPVECAGYIWCWWLSATLLNCVTLLQFTRQWNETQIPSSGLFNCDLLVKCSLARNLFGFA